MSARRNALRAAADLLQDVIHAGDVAEIVAMPAGTSGLAEAVAARDEVHEDPAGALRRLADGMEGADHDSATEAADLLALAQGVPLEADADERTPLFAEALVHATLALVDEQRTANLIAYVANLSRIGLQDGTLSAEQQQRHDRASRQVRERLGLDA